jgi:hypothetical protein
MVTLMFLKKPGAPRCSPTQYSDILIRCRDTYYCADKLAGVIAFPVTSYSLDNWDCIYISCGQHHESRIGEFLWLQSQYAESFPTKLMSYFFPSVIRHWSAAELAIAVLDFLGNKMKPKSTITQLYLALAI